MATLRSHGSSRWPRYKALIGTLSVPCMHGGGIAASSLSVAGWVSDLTAQTHWLSAISAQCLSLFKPVRVDAPVDTGTVPGGHDDGGSLWWRHERMARTVMRNPERLADVVLTERDAIEARWLATLPGGQAAFDEASIILDTWASAVEVAADDTDVRPIWAKRYWEKRDRAAELDR